MPDPDQLNALMSAAARGDETAFRRFYDLSAPSILAFLLRLLGDRYHAEDVLQESMVTAWNRAREFDPERAAATTWITTIARRRALDILRNHARRAEILHDDADNVRSVLGLEDDTGPPAIESDTTGGKLTVCMGELSPDAAACVRYAYLDGLTFSEIAATVERSVGTVKSWVRRGLVKLKACMQR